jgi:hypothetical protein
MTRDGAIVHDLRGPVQHTPLPCPAPPVRCSFGNLRPRRVAAQVNPAKMRYIVHLWHAPIPCWSTWPQAVNPILFP